MRQSINEAAVINRADPTNSFLQLLDEERVNPNKTIFTSHASTTNRTCDIRPDFTAIRSLHPKRLIVWAGIRSKDIIGPFSFKETVNDEQNLALLQDRFIPRIYELWFIDETWFMQDEAPD